MNGTSMASPNACGSIALLLSGMKQEGIPITSARVHKAIVATAKDFNDELGIGFIQTDKAWEYIVANQAREDADFEFTVAVSPPGKPVGRPSTDKRGIYLREKLETARVNQFMATVKPLIKGTEPEKAYHLQLKCNLKSDASWVTSPEFLLLGSNGRSFEIRVDPTHLPPGLHVASVKGYDSANPGLELFDVPVTVTKPEVSTEPTVRYSTTLRDGKLERHFVHVPEGTTWCEARFRSSNHGVEGTTAKFWAHLVTVEPQRRLSFVEQSFVFALTSGEPMTRKFAVKGGQTLEVCLAEMWNAAQKFDIDVDLEFHGITIGHAVSGRDELTLIGGEGAVKIECMSNVRLEAFTPTISFSKRRTFVRPANSVIRPFVDSRNLHPSGKMMGEVVNSYQLTVGEGGPVKLSWPTSSPLSNLYDSAVPMLTAIFETNTKKLVSFGDVYPKAKELAKGEYTVRVQWLNENPAVLKALRTATMTVEQNLSKGKDITLSTYDNHVDLFGAAKPASYKGGAVKLLPGERKVLNLDLNLHGDALPKEAQPGDILVGDFGFAPDGKYTLKYIVAPAPKKEDNGEGGGKEDEPQLPELLAPLTKKLKGDQKKKFLDTLLKDHPTSLPVLLARLESLDAGKKEEVDDVVKAADAVVKEIDVQSVLLYLGEKRLPANEQSEDEKKENKRMEEKKKALVTAYVKKGKALLTKDKDGKDAASASAFKATFESARKLLGETTENREWATLRIANYLRDEGGEGGRPGQALQSVRKLIKEMGVGDSTNRDELAKAKEMERELLAMLGWDVWTAYEDRWRIIGSPKDWAPF
jgi:tripeptidyl-peptidase-2